MALHDPLAGAIERSVEHKKELTKMAGDLLTGAQACELLCIGQMEILRRRDAGQLIAILVGSEFHYPAFQFEDGGVLPGIETLLVAYEDYDSLVIIDMLFAPDAVFDGRNLLSVIQDGDDEAVRRYAAQVAACGFT